MNFNFEVSGILNELRNHYLCSRCNSELHFYTCEEEGWCIKCHGEFRRKRKKTPSLTAAYYYLSGVKDHIIRFERILSEPTVPANQIEILGLTLFTKKFSPTKINGVGETSLFNFCRKRNLCALQASVTDAQFDINHKDYAGWTPLHEAVEHDFFDGIKALLEAGALPNVPGPEYITPLHKAFQKGQVETIRMLLEYGASLESKDYYGMPAQSYKIKEFEIPDINSNKEVKNPIKTVYVSQKMVIYISRDLFQNQKQNLEGLTEFTDTFGANITHALYTESTKLNAWMLMLRGGFVYKETWIDMYINNKSALPIYPNLVPDIHPCYLLALKNALLKNPPLFNGLKFYVLKTKKPYTVEGLFLQKENVVELIKSGGGEILKREPTPLSVKVIDCLPFHSQLSEPGECHHFIIYNEDEPKELMYNMKELQHRPFKWLMACVFSFKLEKYEATATD